MDQPFLDEKELAPSTDLSKEEALRKSDVACFESFYEKAFRLVFPFEDRYTLTAPQHLLTILPTGVVENNKDLQPQKEKGLMAYGFPQTIDASKAATLRETHGERVTPFIWQRDDGSYGLVQTWTTSYNKDWKLSFCEYDYNVCPWKFQPQAVQEFHEAMIKLFGDGARSQKVMFAVSSKKNDMPVYVGRGDHLMQLLRSCPEIRHSLSIIKLSDNGYTTKILNKDGEEMYSDGRLKTKDFGMSMDTLFALYTKKGYEMMACSKPLEQFYNEAAIQVPCEDRPEIPSCLLASPLPSWSYDPDVAKLFFNDPNLIRPLGLPDIPRPILMEHCVGPAVPWAFWRAICLWSVVGMTTIIDLLLAENHVSYAVLLRFQRVCFFLAMLFGIYAEAQCVRLFIVPFVERVHGCPIPLFGLRSFYVWLPVMVVASFVSMLSIQTNAEFMLGVIRREHKQPREVTTWTYLMESSMFGCLGINWEVVTPASFVRVLWVVSTMQLFWPLLEVVIFPGTPVPHFQVMCDYGNDCTWETWACRLRLRAEKIGPYEALLEMANAGGMCTIGCGAYTYPLGYMNDALKMKRQHWEMESMKYFHLAQKQAVKRLVNAGFLKKTLQLKIQLTLYSLRRSMHGNSHEVWTLLFLIIVTLFTGLASQIDTVYTCLKAHLILYREISAKGIDDGSQEMMSRMLIRFSVYIIVWGIVIACGVGYSCLQLVCLQSCSTSLWNLRGCVTEEDLDRFASGN